MQEFRTPDQNNAGTEPDPLCNKHTGYNSHKETTSKLTKLHKPDKTQSTTCISPKETRQNSVNHMYFSKGNQTKFTRKKHTHTHTHTHTNHMDMTETIKLKIHGNGVKKKRKKEVTWIRLKQSKGNLWERSRKESQMTGTDRTKFLGKKYKRVTDMTETDKTESWEISTKESQTVLKQT